MTSLLDNLPESIADLYKLEGFLAYAGFSFVMRNDWAFTDLVNKRMVSYSNDGWYDLLRRKYNPVIHDKCNNNEKISVESIAGVLILVFISGFFVTVAQITFNIFRKKCGKTSGVTYAICWCWPFYTFKNSILIQMNLFHDYVFVISTNSPDHSCHVLFTYSFFTYSTLKLACKAEVVIGWCTYDYAIKL